MKGFLLIFQVIVSVALISLILLQARGTGFGRSFSSGSQASFSRRGLEKFIFKLTFILVAVFIVVSILQIII
jgi:protein translocase SecG subunit